MKFSYGDVPNPEDCTDIGRVNSPKRLANDGSIDVGQISLLEYDLPPLRRIWTAVQMNKKRGIVTPYRMRIDGIGEVLVKDHMNWGMK